MGSNYSGDGRRVATDALATLGTILGDAEDRDAIHLAVVAARAGERLLPGESVKVQSDGRAVGVDLGDGVGIVDPFLPQRVDENERFWLVIRPGMITSLRHVWALPELDAILGSDAGEVASDSPARTEAIAWLTNFAGERLRTSYAELMLHAAEWVRSETEWCPDDYSAGFEAIPAEFWDHYHAVTGVRGRGDFIICSC